MRLSAVRTPLVVVAVLSLSLAGLTAPASADDDQVGQRPAVALVPRPVTLEEGSGNYVLHSRTRIAAAGEAAPVGAYLAEHLRPSTGYDLPVEGRARGPQPILIAVHAGGAPAGHEEEGYRLSVTPKRIDLTASTAAGAINGVQTLRQLFGTWASSPRPVTRTWAAPAVSIEDYPSLSYRGVGVDVARSFYTVDQIKTQIDAAAAVKINTLHLHLTDDQGWRIAMESPARNPSVIDYESLTSVSGATAMTYNDKGELMGTELGHAGFFSQTDYSEIVAYAAQNGMTVVPEIDMPGHVNAALHALPQLTSAGSAPQPAPGESTPPAQGTPNVGYSTLDADNPATIEFVREVLTQLAELTPGPYLHIGGDEAHTTSHEDYLSMINKFAEVPASLGKQVVGWNEYGQGDLPKNSIIQYWAGDRQATAEDAVRTGAKVILSPAATAYVPQKQDSRQTQGGTWACGGPCTLEQHYSWDPLTYLPGLPSDQVLGVESVLWGEFIRGTDQAQFYQWPRMLATAEVGWTPTDDRDFADFTQRVGQLGGALTVAGVNFFPTAEVPWALDLTAELTGKEQRLQVQVTAPSIDPAQLRATVRWADGAKTSLTLAGDREVSIPEMRQNAVLVGSAAGATQGPLPIQVEVSSDDHPPVTIVVPA